MESHIYIYNEIGEGGVTAEMVQQELAANPDSNEIIVHISSPGGEVFEGWTIGNILKNSGKRVNTIIEGMCASIATYIALQGDRVKMSETAMFMIHNPSTMVMGEKKDLEGEIKVLDKIKDDLVKTYRKKTGLSPTALAKMMDDETYMNSTEARKLNFVDEIMKPARAVAFLNPDKIKPMTEEIKEPSKLERLHGEMLDALNNLTNLIAPKSFKNITIELAEGGSIFVESEDGELEGKTAYIADDEGNRTEELVPEGTYKLIDNREVVIGADGVVQSVSEGMEEAALEDQILDLKAQLEAKEAENKELNDKISQTNKEQETILAEIEKTKNLVKENELKIKNSVFGEVTNLKKPNTPAGDLSDVEIPVHKLDGFAASLKKQRADAR